MWKCPPSIWSWDSNPRPLEHESSPITTRPGLPLYTFSWDSSNFIWSCLNFSASERWIAPIQKRFRWHSGRVLLYHYAPLKNTALSLSLSLSKTLPSLSPSLSQKHCPLSLPLSLSLALKCLLSLSISFSFNLVNVLFPHQYVPARKIITYLD